MTLTVTGEGATAKKTTEDSDTRSEKTKLLISANGDHRKVNNYFKNSFIRMTYIDVEIDMTDIYS